MSDVWQVQDETYIKILIDAIEVCKSYKPKFGHGVGLTLAEFQSLYQADPFYSWFGLDSSLMYSAHKAAGGMTSVYRQIGIGCQRLIQRIIMDTLGLTYEQSSWSYQVQKTDSKIQTLSLDSRIPLVDVQTVRQGELAIWLQSSCREVGVVEDVRKVIKGAVFEIRQGYKSKDSKRQNADIANAATAFAEGYLPVLLLLSSQIDDDVAYRYKNARWIILRGTITGSTTTSTYEFCRQVLGYDLGNFLERYSTRIKEEIELVLKALLG